MFIYDHDVFEAQVIRFFDKRSQSIIVRLEKREKGTNLSAEYDISDICKNTQTILKFANILETSEGLKQKLLKVAHDDQLDKVLYVWFIQERTSGTSISGPLNDLQKSCFTINCRLFNLISFVLH